MPLRMRDDVIGIRIRPGSIPGIFTMTNEPPSDCVATWPGRDHEHECAEGDRCWRKGIHECWCGATIVKESADA